MPLHMDIVPIHRLVAIVAHGEITADDLANNVKELIEARVAHYAKIIDVSTSHWVLTKEQIDRIAETLRGDPNSDMRGPVAFIVRPDDEGFAKAFAGITEGDRPVRPVPQPAPGAALARRRPPGREPLDASRGDGSRHRRSQTVAATTPNTTSP